MCNFLVRLFVGSCLLSAFAMSSCVKRTDPVPFVLPDTTVVPTTATVHFRFTPVAGTEPLVLNNAWYTTQSGDSLKVNLHKYFISNISLINDSNREVKLPDTSLLVDAADLRTFTFSKVPIGHYSKVSFLIGVDSIRNVSGIQEGDLDPNGRASGMFWDWNTGYIMAKVEGFSPQSSFVTQGVSFHIGGFSGRNSVLRRVTLPLPTMLDVEAGKQPTVQVTSDVLSWFNGSVPLSFQASPQIMSVGREAAQLADNYSKGYRVVRIDP